MQTYHQNLQKQLNNCMPIAKEVGLGDLLQALVSHVTTLETQLATLAVKLNNDAGVTDTNYAPTTAATAIPAIPTK